MGIPIEAKSIVKGTSDFTLDPETAAMLDTLGVMLRRLSERSAELKRAAHTLALTAAPQSVADAAKVIEDRLGSEGDVWVTEPGRAHDWSWVEPALGHLRELMQEDLAAERDC